MRSPVAFIKKKKKTPLLTVDDEDLSNSSTLTSSSFHKPQQAKIQEQEHASFRIARISKVKFDETRNDASLTAANALYNRECWYSQSELVQFKKSVIIMGRKLLNSTDVTDCTYRRVLTCTYNLCRSVPYEVDTARGSILCPRDQADLRKCMMDDTTTNDNKNPCLERMGLDRLTVPVLMEEQNGAKKRVVAKVKELQDKDSFRQLSFHSQSQVLQAALESLSRPGRLLARETARALAKSCCASSD